MTYEKLKDPLLPLLAHILNDFGILHNFYYHLSIGLKC